MRKPLFLCMVIIAFSLGIAPFAYSNDGYQIMLKNYNLDEGNDVRANLKMELIKKNGKRRIREVTYWKIERGDEDKQLPALADCLL